MKRSTFFRFLVILFCLMLYANVGWHLGTYYYENVAYTVPQTVLAKSLSGGWSFLAKPDTPPALQDTLTTVRILYSILWPIVLFGMTISWIIFGAWNAFCWLFWLIFQGGFGQFIAQPVAPYCFAVGMAISVVFATLGPTRTEKPAWIIALICFFFCLISFII